MIEHQTDALAELDAMKTVAEALAALDEEAIRRVLGWAADRFEVTLKTRGKTEQQEEVGDTNETEADTVSQFEGVADLYSAVAPTSDPDRALVIGYWFQVLQGAGDFDSYRLNRELKHMGHGVSNITSALGKLMARKPQLVIQTKKGGSSQQARKRYKLTTEGIRTIESMIRGG